MRMMKNATTSSISKTSARALWSMSLKSAAFLASAPRSRLEMIRLPCAPLASKPATIVETPPPTCSPPVPTYGTYGTYGKVTIILYLASASAASWSP